jgi:uncharacterized alkaline shock family protein YloU
MAGRGLATRRAIVDIVRSVTLGSYGVVAFGASLGDRLFGALTGRPAGIRVSLADGGIAIELRLRVAHGLPIAEVARQVDSAIRFAIRRALGREVASLKIRIAGLEVKPASQPPRAAEPRVPGSSDLADSGTDVA